MRSVDDHAAVVAALVPTPQTTAVPVSAITGRVLAATVTAPIALPGFDNSAMDGYAVRTADLTPTPVTLPVAADIPAGRTDRLELQPGTVHRIMTGAPLPQGADAVVQVELTDGGDVTVRIDKAVPVGTAIRAAGSDITAGDVALPAGTVVGAAQVGLLSALGISTAEVRQQLRVLVLSTGTELVAPGTPLKFGQIYESNAPMLAAAVESAGAKAFLAQTVTDDVYAFHGHLQSEIDRYAPDLIITSGGVSAGAFEVVKEALADTVEFTKVAMQPGMPQGSGRYRGIPIVTFPGNPVSAQISFEVFLRAPLLAAAGLPDRRLRTPATLTDDIVSIAGKRQFRRGILRHSASGTTVAPIGPPSSHHLRYLASANALIDTAADVTEVKAGSIVDVTELP